MDLNIQAFRLVSEATEGSSTEDKRKQAASRRGGLLGGRARAKALPPDKRTEIAKKASLTRWSRVQEVST